MSINRRTFLRGAGLAAAPLFLGGMTGHPRSRSTGEFSTASNLPPPDRFDPWVEVVRENLVRGVDEVSRLSGGRPILAVVKNNAYGLDLATAGQILEKEPGILGFAVVKGEEALKLRSSGIRKPILLMGMFSDEEGPALAEAHVEFGVFTRDAAERLVPLARAVGSPVGIHFYLDSGMGRMGMSFRNALPWMEELSGHPEITVRGTFTELGEDPEFDLEQLRRFLSLVREAGEAGVETGKLHAAASNGVFHLPEGHLDLVRPGIALFGSYPSRPDEEREMATLNSALRLKARVVRVSHLQAGDGVGYGRPWVADSPTWVATLPIGHADGYPREAVRGAQVLIRDRLFPVIGGVSASHCVVKIGDHRAVAVGDEVVLMGPDNPILEPSAMAQALGVSVYDLLMHVNPSLPRIVVEE
jgi:alanine racemase